MSKEKKNGGNNPYKASKAVDKFKKIESFGGQKQNDKDKKEKQTQGGYERSTGKGNYIDKKRVNAFDKNEKNSVQSKDSRYDDKASKNKGMEDKDYKQKGHKGSKLDYKESAGTFSRYYKESVQGKKHNEYKENKSFHDKNTSNNKSVKEFKNTDKNAKCPVIYKCGGCQMLHLDYAKQLKEKQKQVEELLGKYAKIEPIIGMENPDHYRNKVHAVFDHDRKGNAISGVYEAGTHRVIPIDGCLIENEKADEIIVSIRGLLKSFKIKTYDEDTEYGLLRHVLIRTGHKSGQIMVVLVLASPILPSKSNFVKALLKLHPEITTIIINVNNKKTSMVLGDKEQVIYGKGYIEDTLCNKVFHISPKSFYQVNPVQTEVLYGKAIELANLTGKETVIDAYCGIGTIGIIASDAAKKVIGVELNQDAVKDAVTNAKKNQANNIDFYNKDAGEFMNQMAVQEQKAEVVFMDPPRAGSDEKFLTSLCTLSPDRVVYISCNPVTLARDLEFLVKKGYKVKRVIPVDMFPNTGHVESIILLQKKNS